MKSHDFGWALTQMRDGLRVQRLGWNGKGMWIAIHNPDPGREAMTHQFIYMKTANEHLVPWLASQADMLEDDWELFDG